MTESKKKCEIGFWKWILLDVISASKEFFQWLRKVDPNEAKMYIGEVGVASSLLVFLCIYSQVKLILLSPNPLYLYIFLLSMIFFALL